MEPKITQVDLDLAGLRQVNTLDEQDRESLKLSLARLKLLTPAIANSKTAKNDAELYSSYILHLAPSDLSGWNVCPNASEGCKAACLNTAGRGGMIKRGETTNMIQQARLRKTLYFVAFRKEFLRHLNKEIQAAQLKASKQGKKCVVRLNGTSDLQFETMAVNGIATLFDLNPQVQFYDYTKIYRRLTRRIPSNLDLTFSMSESNSESALAALDLGFRVAVVFSKIPDQYLGVEVVNGDNTDLRFLDKRGVFIGLNAKGKAKKDASGFVKHV